MSSGACHPPGTLEAELNPEDSAHYQYHPVVPINKPPIFALSLPLCVCVCSYLFLWWDSGKSEIHSTQKTTKKKKERKKKN
jgi:hypothetical protein